MDDIDKIKQIKKEFDKIYIDCLNRYDTCKAILKLELVNEGYITNEYGAIVIFSGDYIFLTDNSTVYKRIYHEINTGKKKFS
jgi:hypothetical protein